MNKIIIDIDKRSAIVNGEEIFLCNSHIKLLSILSHRISRTEKEISDYVYGGDYQGVRLATTHLSQLKRVIGEFCTNKRHIGYLLLSNVTILNESGREKYKCLLFNTMTGRVQTNGSKLLSLSEMAHLNTDFTITKSALRYTLGCLRSELNIQ